MSLFLPFGKGDWEWKDFLPFPWVFTGVIVHSIHQTRVCNVLVSGESRRTQQNSSYHSFGSSSSKMIWCMYHLVEIEATGPHTDQHNELRTFLKEISKLVIVSRHVARKSLSVELGHFFVSVSASSEQEC